MQNIFNVLASVPALAQKYITFDNGTKFAGHTLLKYGMKMDRFFCDPSSPWQKGQVAKTNTMLQGLYLQALFYSLKISKLFL